MDIYQLEYFKTIAEAQSMTEAADKLHVSQPALSRSLKKLEEELGCPLFDRMGRRIELNEVGNIAYHYTAAALDSIQRISREVSQYQRAKNMTVSLYAPVPLGRNEEIIVDFTRRHPDIRLRVAVVPSERIMHEVPDFMFFASPVLHQEPNYLILGEEDIALAVPSNDPLAQCPSVALRDLANRRFLQVTPSSITDQLAGMCEEAGFEPNVVMENQSYAQLITLVGMGYGLALVPSVTWFNGQEQNVTVVPLSDVRRHRYLYLKWTEGVGLSPAACILRDYLVDHFAAIAPLPAKLRHASPKEP